MQGKGFHSFIKFDILFRVEPGRIPRREESEGAARAVRMGADLPVRRRPGGRAALPGHPEPQAESDLRLAAM